MIWIIGGTIDAREFLNSLEDKEKDASFIVSVATLDALEFLEEYKDKVHIGRMTKEEMLDFIKSNKIDVCVDLSHPHAKVVSENAKEACIEANIKYYRYSGRNKVSKELLSNKQVHFFNTYEDVFSYLEKIEEETKGETFLITTGVNKSKDFEDIKGDRRFIYRVLPSITSITKMHENGIKMKDMIGVLGPISKDFNKAMLKEYNAKYLIMKDSGEAANSMDRIDSALECNVSVLIIKMEEESGYQDFNDILSEIFK